MFLNGIEKKEKKEKRMNNGELGVSVSWKHKIFKQAETIGNIEEGEWVICELDLLIKNRIFDLK